MSNRRTFLALGGAALFWTFTGGMLRAADFRGRPLPEGDAYAPWELWNDPSLRGAPLALLAAGVLAANPHDTQPWLFKVGDDSIEVYADTSRNLGAMDGYAREMFLGLGCAIENMSRAAGPNGYAVEVTSQAGSLTDLDERRAPVLAATLRLAKLGAAAPDPLYAALPQRHTNRYAYDRAKKPPAAWRLFVEGFGEDVRVFLFDDGARREAFDAGVIDATAAIIADPVMIADSDRWFRDSREAIDAHRDGPTLDAAGLSTTTLLFARLFSVSPETSHKAWFEQTRDTQVPTAPVTGFLAVRDRYDRAGALKAGRAWQHLHLDATTRGMAMQPLNQPIEMIDRERRQGSGTAWGERAARLTGDDWQATFAFRAGFALSSASASPRRRLGDVLMS